MPAYPKAMIGAGVHGSKHKTIRHRDKVYVVGDVHTNTVENAFSLLKRGIMGTWHKISAKHLAVLPGRNDVPIQPPQESRFIPRYAAPHGYCCPVLTFEKLTA